VARINSDKELHGHKDSNGRIKGMGRLLTTSANSGASRGTTEGAVEPWVDGGGLRLRKKHSGN
jgi:hypothetical protein